MTVDPSDLLFQTAPVPLWLLVAVLTLALLIVLLSASMIFGRRDDE